MGHGKAMHLPVNVENELFNRATCGIVAPGPRESASRETVHNIKIVLGEVKDI